MGFLFFNNLIATNKRTGATEKKKKQMKHIYFIETPICKSCGLEMESWNPFSDEHEHVLCTSNRITDSLIEIVKKDLNDRKN